EDPVPDAGKTAEHRERLLSTVVGPALPPGIAHAKAMSLIGSAAVTAGVFLLGFVHSEPAPYELYMVGLIAVWGLFGLRFSRHAAILLGLFVIFNIGGVLSMAQMDELYETPLYLAVSLFLAFTAVFFVAIVRADHRRYHLIFMAWTASALVTGALGIAGYFGL